MMPLKNISSYDTSSRYWEEHSGAASTVLNDLNKEEESYFFHEDRHHHNKHHPNRKKALVRKQNKRMQNDVSKAHTSSQKTMQYVFDTELSEQSCYYDFLKSLENRIMMKGKLENTFSLEKTKNHSDWNALADLKQSIVDSSIYHESSRNMSVSIAQEDALVLPEKILWSAEEIQRLRKAKITLDAACQVVIGKRTTCKKESRLSLKLMQVTHRLVDLVKKECLTKQESVSLSNDWDKWFGLSQKILKKLEKDKELQKKLELIEEMKSSIEELKEYDYWLEDKDSSLSNSFLYNLFISTI